MINVLSIDVEDYWAIFGRDWLKQNDALPSEAVLCNTRWYLDFLGERNIKATFFILGEVAKAYPELVEEIAGQGHEIAVHGFSHKQIFRLNRAEFINEVGDAKKLLEDISGQEVIGHRAPAFSINYETKWALDVLAELGYKYDSSISPMAGSRYGWPNFKKEIHRMQIEGDQSIIEVPMSTVSFVVKELCVGGGYLRHFPYLFTKIAMKHIQKKRPVILYMHPYEIDTKELEVSFECLSETEKRRVLKFHRLQMRNRHTIKQKMEKLCSDFNFTTIKNLIENADI